nr:hypothetical protein CFP56_32384 [Quercus suber]
MGLFMIYVEDYTVQWACKNAQLDVSARWVLPPLTCTRASCWYTYMYQSNDIIAEIGPWTDAIDRRSIIRIFHVLEAFWVSRAMEISGTYVGRRTVQ